MQSTRCFDQPLLLEKSEYLDSSPNDIQVTTRSTPTAPTSPSKQQLRFPTSPRHLKPTRHDSFSQAETDLTEMSSQHSGDLEYADYGDDDSWGLHINGSFDCSHINNTDDTDSSCSSLLIQMHLPSHQQQKRQELPRGMPKRITLIEEREDINKDTNVFERLQLAEKLIHAYKDALQSKEDLIDSLHENLENTKGVAEDLLQEQGNLLEAIQTLENYQEDTGYLKVVMVCCLMYYFLFNHHNEYILIFAMSLYILQDFILACI